MAPSFADVIAVVPAAGIGSRMQTECPKQYLTIGNQTILEHAVAPLLQHPRISRVIIAISPADTAFARLPLAAHPDIQVVRGGAQRADSVLAGLQPRATRAGRWCMTPRARVLAPRISNGCWP